MHSLSNCGSQICYDDGEVEAVSLFKERWEVEGADKYKKVRFLWIACIRVEFSCPLNPRVCLDCKYFGILS